MSVSVIFAFKPNGANISRTTRHLFSSILSILHQHASIIEHLTRFFMLGSSIEGMVGSGNS